MTEEEMNLRALLADPETVAALEGIYERQIQRILATLANGISQPGAARAVTLISRIRELISDLNPAADTAVRAWIKENVAKAFVLGDDDATNALRKELDEASSDERDAFGSVSDSFTAVNQTAMRAITSLMEETLKGAAADMLNVLIGAIRRTQLALHMDAGVRGAVTGGIIRGATYSQLSDDIANVILQGSGDAASLARLSAAGFQPDLLKLYQQLAQGQFIRIGNRTYSVRAYANLVARTMLAEATNTATIVRSQQNGIDHVQVSWHVQKEPDICTLFAGRVFFIGAGDDPLGFPNYNEIPKLPLHPNCRHRLMPYVAALKSLADIEGARNDANLIPDDFFSQEAREIEKKLEELTPAQWKAIQPRSTELLPQEFFTPEPPASAAA